MNVAVLGGSGYVAGELLRLLLGHPEVRGLTAVSRSHAGEAFTAVHPHLAVWPGRRFAAASPADAARGCDVVFLALEHGASAALLDDVLAAEPGLVIDLAQDHRLDPRFTYALADVAGSDLRGKTLLAAPGCFATAAQLALYPLAALAQLGFLALFAITGSSGGGAALRPAAHHPLRANDAFAYALDGHRHQLEIDASWRRWRSGAAPPVRLLAHSGPFVRGILLTLHARSADAGAAPGAFSACYEAHPFIRLVREAPHVTHVVGTNDALIHVRAQGDEIVVSVVIDNLLKGAGGQAVQAMNLALGLDETLGLTLAPAFPC